ncbi:family 1 glycosylhydrolase, partial [uncultured Ligilactobacillus sp.]|uniref:family 1 glycosylhydrolase n=1 Tax=uncultured Ligilactobacillus sp. TaxID=2837633 RepID=UPI00272CF7F9
MPLYLAKEYGGFRNKNVIDHFVKFAETVFKRYKGKVCKTFITGSNPVTAFCWLNIR